ncbi:carbohydrate ABC transporter permease [Streptomyces odontomachi]|uniref:carbohydrate ABC transporter permease n=1 Tax=Streptomyces odontomachi TaxID=2944940 RepID=UPI002109F20D|nr:carbohydrate ABC transporter permease [Streptomyces sp. ODS25]
MTLVPASRPGGRPGPRNRPVVGGPHQRDRVGAVGRVVLLVGYLVPVLMLLATSLKSRSEVLSNPSGLLFSPTLDSYRAVLADAVPALLNSAQIAAGTTLLTVLLAVPAAYGLARRRTRAWSRATAVFLGIMIVLQMVPQPMSVIPLYSLLADVHLTNTIFGVVLATTALQIPFAVLLLRPFFLSVPPELEEAALVDGASLPRMFFSVIVPMARNGVVTVAVMVFMISWGEFIYGTTLLTTPEGYPISALLAQQISLYGTEWGRLMALAALATLPILVIFLVSQRRLTAGLLTGALK